MGYKKHETQTSCGLLHPKCLLHDDCSQEEEQEVGGISNHHQAPQELLAFSLNIGATQAFFFFFFFFGPLMGFEKNIQFNYVYLGNFNFCSSRKLGNMCKTEKNLVSCIVDIFQDI